MQFTGGGDFQTCTITVDPGGIHVDSGSSYDTFMADGVVAIMAAGADGFSGTAGITNTGTYAGKTVTATVTKSDFVLHRTGPVASSLGYGGTWELTSQFRSCSITIEGNTFGGTCTTMAGDEKRVYPSGFSYSFNGSGTPTMLSGSDSLGVQFAATKR